MRVERAQTRAATELWWPSDAHPDDRPTERFGDYVVYEQLGLGGMATVHRAEKCGIDGFRRPVALKRMLAAMSDNLELVDAFVHEAQLTSQLRHANIAQTYDLGHHEGTYFMAMELVQGPTLLQLMRQCSSAAGPVPLPIAVNILIQICDALEYAHQVRDGRGRSLGIIHRDISPTNIIVSNTGLVKVIDFGIAKAATSRAQTQVGFVKGKFAYVAPEYIGGQLDARADLFALGVVAHELLTNERLFRARNDLETLENLRSMRIRPPSEWNPDVPASLDGIVMRALERDPKARWQDAGAMRAALVRVARELGAPVGNQQVLDWVTWAFEQQSHRANTQLVRVLEDLEVSYELLPGVAVSIDEPSAATAPRAAAPSARQPRAPSARLAETSLITTRIGRLDRALVQPWMVAIALAGLATAAWYLV